MSDGSSGRSRVTLQPCCEERLEKLRDVQGLGEITESLVATSPFLGTFSTDEQAMAEALFREAGTDAQKLYAVFDHLADTSSADADDVARAYLELVREEGRDEMKTIRADPMLADLLADLLEAGWTTESEAEHVRYLQYLKSVSRR